MHQAQASRKSSHVHISGSALAMLVLANAALAIGPLFVREADVGPISAGLWRMALAAPVLLAVATRAPGGFAPGRQVLLPLLFGGIAFAGDLASWHMGIVRTTLANATLFGNSATLMYPVYGFVVARTLPTKGQAAALLLAAFGAALLLGRSAELSSRHLSGDLLCVLAGLLYTVFFITMAQVRARLAPAPALALSTISSILPLLLLAWAMGEHIWPHLWWPLLAMTALSQLFGQGLMTRALGHLPPLVIGIALLVQPIVAAALGWIVYGETLAGLDLVGAAMVAAALVMVRGGAKVAPPPEGVMTLEEDAK
jgi:drug/metabolite transporter (DMT)-like permease